jgi:homoserine trans-succinylase
MPVSRWTEMRRDEIEAAGLPVLLHSDEVGPALVEDPGTGRSTSSTISNTTAAR